MHNAYQESDLTERMRLNSLGRLLINTTTDTGHHLSVNGAVKSAGALTIGSEVLNTNFSSSLMVIKILRLFKCVQISNMPLIEVLTVMVHVNLTGLHLMGQIEYWWKNR